MGWWVGQATAVAIVLAWVVVLSPAARRLALVPGRRVVAARRLWRPAPPPELPERRPIEVIAHEARRLGHRFRETRTGVSFVKAEGVRRAYDEVLGEGCDALEIPHLLTVLPDGPELDLERHRVERLLHIWGLDLDDAA